MSVAVDPDDLSTWPGALRAGLEDALTRCSPTEFTSDLDIPLSDTRLVTLFEGRPLRAYHATRLLEHEVQDVREEGLHAVSPQHVENRISRAVGAGAITAPDAELIRQSTAYVTPREGSWEGRVCLVEGLTCLLEFPHGVEPLLSCWGGEVIYWNAPPTTKQLLKRLGAPSIVVVDLPVGPTAHWFPPLARVLAGRLAGLSMPWGEVHYLHSVPASSVVGIWQPGDPEYDRFPGLPRE